MLYNKKNKTQKIPSKLLQKEKHFILLLLNTSKIQAQCLLDTSTTQQIKTVSEISRNLLKLPLSGEAEIQVKKKKFILNKLASYSISNRSKSLVISKYNNSILVLLRSVKQPLVELLS